MEEMDTVKVLGGLAIGAAVMAFMKFGAGNSAAEAQVEEEVKKAPAKKKKKGPKAKSTFVPQKLVAIDPTATAPVAESPASTEGKKKKKKKKKSGQDAAAKAAAEAKAKAEAEAAAKAKAKADAKAAKKKKKKAKKAATAEDKPLPLASETSALPTSPEAESTSTNGYGHTTVEVEDGWSVVASKSRKPKVKKTVESTTEGGESTGPVGTSVTIELSSQDRSSIIGKGGKNIQQIQLESGANLNIPKDTDELVCVITGTEEQVAIAKDLVLEYQKYRGPKPEMTTTIPVTHRDIMLLLANGGANIKAFRSQYETQLEIAKRDGSSAEEVTVSGNRDEVMKTIGALRTFFAAHSAEKLIPLETDRIVQAVYGPAGARRKEIQDKTGARLDIDKMDKVVNLTGTKEQIAQAELMVIQVMKDERGPPKLAAGEVCEMIEIGGATGQIVGAGGKTINGLQARTGAKIDIKDDNTCYVFGAPSDVEVCAKEVKDIVNKYNENISKTQSTTSSYEVEGVQGDWDVPPLDEKWVPGITSIPQDGGSDGWGNGPQGWGQ